MTDVTTITTCRWGRTPDGNLRLAFMDGDTENVIEWSRKDGVRLAAVVLAVLNPTQDELDTILSQRGAR